MRSGLVTSSPDFCFWQGASGTRYVHHIYTLIGCPQLPLANYVLFAKGSDGRRRAIFAGHTTHDSGSLNLAEVRYLGANLGAAEVHVHLLATDEAHRALIAADLREALIDDVVNAKERNRLILL